MSGDLVPRRLREKDDDDIVRLTEELQRSAGDHTDDPLGPRAIDTDDAECLRLAEAMIVTRRKIGEHFQGTLFADPARDLLLDLYVAALREREIPVSSACIAAAVPATTALRWINRLRIEGLVTIQPDLRDRRRMLVRLSGEAQRGMELYLSDVLSLLRPAV